MEKKERNNKEITNWTCFTIGLLASWFLSFLFFTIPIGLVIWLICVIILFRNRSKLKWFVIIFSGWAGLYTISFTFAIKDYFNGEARFIGIGLPGPGSRNIDKIYRVSSTSSGCMVIGYELITNPANNLAIKACVTLFGYQKGSYLGYYPSQEESIESINLVKDTISFSLERSTLFFTLDHKEYKIENGWLSNPRIPDTCYYARATIVKDQVLAFRPICSDGYDEFTLLINTQNNQPFAWYYDYMMKN